MHTAKENKRVQFYQAGGSRSGLCGSLDAGQDGQYTYKPWLLYHEWKRHTFRKLNKHPTIKSCFIKKEIQILSQ